MYLKCGNISIFTLFTLYRKAMLGSLQLNGHAEIPILNIDDIALKLCFPLHFQKVISYTTHIVYQNATPAG